MQITLKDLLAVVAFCGVVAGCAAFVGHDNGLYWFFIGAASVVSVLFVWMARKPKLLAGIAAVTVPVAFFSLFLFMSLLLACFAFLLTLAGIILARRPTPTLRTLIATTAGCFLATLAIGILPGITAMRELEAVRKDYPIITLANRLQYEKRSQAKRAANQPAIDSSVDTQLVSFEESLDQNRYGLSQLQSIHDRNSEAFVRAVGFGVGRMDFQGWRYAGRPPLRDIQFNESASGIDSNGRYQAWDAFENAGRWKTVDDLHRISRADFFDPVSFGVNSIPTVAESVVNSPSKWVGFVEHGIHYPPRAALEDHEAWSIDRLELVSLLKFDGPRVYVLDHLPRMDQLAANDAPTRALDEFEAAALPQLATEKDVVVEQQGDSYRMLGSLRAAKQCLNCHSVERGELLGAFSYAIRRGTEQGKEAN